jgi:glycosyltransferase involved in cell wall biosynthesis
VTDARAPRLRVAVDATPLYGPRTGVGRFTHELIFGLAGHPEVEVVAYATTWRGRGRLPTLVPAGVATNRRPMAAAPLRAAWRRFDGPRIERWVGAVDVVHGTNFVVPPARAAQVVTVHDLTAVHHPDLVTDDVSQYPGLIVRALRRGAFVHTVSDFVRHEVIDHFGVAAHRVVTVPNGLTASPPGDRGRGQRLAGGPRYVLALATIEPRKDLPSLVRAFEALAAEQPDLRLVVAGPDGWGVEAYQEAVGAAAHRDRIVRFGFVEEQERGDLLAGASVLASSSLYEGFGLTPGEAMLAGTPVVATAAGAVPEVVGEAGVLVPPGDPAALAAGLRSVLTDGSLADDLRRRGLERAARFHWRRSVDGIVALWRRAAGDEQAGR